MAGASQFQKMVFAVRAKPGLSRADALEHLRRRHAPLLVAASTNRRRLKTYIQNYAVDCSGVPGLTRQRDWIIESWRDPSVLLPEPPVAPDAILVREDEARFPDRKGVLAIDVMEHPVWRADPDAPFSTMPFKVFTYFRKPDASSRRVFLDAWERAARALSDHPAFRAHAASYVRNIAIPGIAPRPTDPAAAPVAARKPAYAGIDIWRFGSKAAISALFRDEGFSAALDDFEQMVVAPGSLFRLAAIENKIFDDARIDVTTLIDAAFGK